MKNIWKLDFRKLWGTDGDGETWNDPDCSSEQVEIFIESILEKQKKELIEEILKLGQTDGGYRDMVWKELIESLKH